jgi:prepilin-type N-terminal cleavage/methylation domain-containing protein
MFGNASIQHANWGAFMKNQRRTHQQRPILWCGDLRNFSYQFRWRTPQADCQDVYATTVLPSKIANPKSKMGSAGFTLIESLVVMAIVGILAAISGPTLLGLLNGHNLSTAQSQAYQTIQAAQSQADRTRTSWDASFRIVNDRVEATAHPANSVPSAWEPLPTGVRIDAAETTLLLSNGIYQAEFNHLNGRVNGQLGRITFVGNSGSSARRCVMVSTLLGTLRKGESQRTPDSGGRFCY